MSWLWLVVGEFGDAPIVSRREEGKERRCGVCKSWRASTCWQRANFADLSAVNRTELYQGHYRREMSHDPPTHTQHITVCDFIDLALYSTRTGNADATGAREKWGKSWRDWKTWGQSPEWEKRRAAELIDTLPRTWVIMSAGACNYPPPVLTSHETSRPRRWWWWWWW